MTTRDKNLLVSFIRQSAAGGRIRKMRDRILKTTGGICDDLDANNIEETKNKIVKLEGLILDYENILEHTFMDCGALAQTILDNYDLNNLPEGYVGCQFVEE